MKNEDEIEEEPKNGDYELSIPTWDAQIPADWALEIATVSSGDDNVTEVGEYIKVAGTTIHATAGTRLRGLPPAVAEQMLKQGFIREAQ